MNAQIDISRVILRTKRLILRPWKQSDLDDFFEYASVDGVGQKAGWIPHKTKEDSQFILNRFIEHKKTFALELNGKVIGSLGIEEYNEKQFPEFENKKCREIGYVLSKSYWGQGLMPEAVNEVIRYLFEDVGLDVIFCGHFLSNHQSQRVQEKCGFKHYAFGKYETKYNTIEDDETNILTKEDWLKLINKSKGNNMNRYIAYCGLNCEKCDAYIATKNNDQELKEKTAKYWSELNGATIQAKDINCEGCRTNGCKSVYCESLCPIRKCAQIKGFETCLDCENIYNCEKIKPIIENSDALNNLKNNK